MTIVLVTPQGDLLKVRSETPSTLFFGMSMLRRDTECIWDASAMQKISQPTFSQFHIVKMTLARQKPTA